eukprot:5480795-Amphidinium_carterae.2
MLMLAVCPAARRLPVHSVTQNGQQPPTISILTTPPTQVLRHIRTSTGRHFSYYSTSGRGQRRVLM